MFSRALECVERFTCPVVMSQRTINDHVTSMCASCIVVNRQGWILTAAHVLKQIALLDEHRPEVEKYMKERDAILAISNLAEKVKRKRVGHLNKKQEWVTHQGVMWMGSPSAQIRMYHANWAADIAIGKLETFDESAIKEYPVFKNPASPMLRGTSLCRLGFPFYEINASFDPTTGLFALAPNTFPIPLFPNEGIHTRIVILKDPTHPENDPVKFIETSSPGLKGQSGGPIFDAHGNVWAMQSNTQTWPLGFSGTRTDPDGRKIVEHQFMNVGWGAHVEEIVKLFRQFSVEFKLSD